MLKEYIRFDCRHFSGAKPCQFQRPCKNCDSYSPMGRRILIIKFASAGDVLRTTVILPALKKRYPLSHISWLVAEPAQGLLETNPHIDRILVFNLESALLLQAEEFDMVISLDKAVEAVSIATLIKAKEKYGFGLSKEGKLRPFNKEAEYSFLLGLDNDLKFYKNKKTYQELVFDIAGLTYAKERYALKLDPKAIDFAEAFFKDNNLDKEGLVIGINTGSGKVFANKNLKQDRIIELIKSLDRQIGAKIILLGGPLEKEINEYIVSKISRKITNTGYTHSLKEFAALINKCSLIITSDTLALHIAVALKKPAVALFGPTAHQEIDLYDLGYKIISHAECAPCYKNKCDKQPTCMDKIDLEEIIKASKKILATKNVAGV